jgi:diacylglycerol kinase family enzyme
VVAEVETRGAEDDCARAAETVAQAAPDVLAALGGDGTANLALRALLEAKLGERTALGLLPLGTGNNVARSFGLRPLAEGEAALSHALGALESGPRRAVDVGWAGERPFLGCFALGMDADVLRLRNGMHRALGVEGGYPLYLAGVAAGLARRAHGGRARLWLDGVRETCDLFNLAVVNTPVYAGPLCFDAASNASDGRLDVHAVASPREYLVEYPRAWLRYLRRRSGAQSRPSALLRRARELRVDFERPVAAQADGEELGAAASFRIHVSPRALLLCTPA